MNSDCDEDARCVDLLVAGATNLYQEVIDPALRRGQFALELSQGDDRLILGPGETLYAVTYSIRRWNSTDRGRFVWFMLDSQLPYVSSIVACLGFPAPARAVPILAMNLNLKLVRRSFSVVLGVRGPAQHRARITMAAPPSRTPPKFTQSAPVGFDGVRFMFALDAEPIQWSLAEAQRVITDWITSSARPAGSSSANSVTAAYERRYREEMRTLHAEEGQSFDKVFGQGWVVNLFAEHVLQ